MASVLFSNNASADLAASITSSATTITLVTGAGSLFPAISGGNFFYATLTDSSNNLEIVKVTARASDVLTVVRAQEGTTARAYAAADKVELRVTAAALTDYVSLAIAAAKEALYPVGSLYINAASSDNPATLLGFGTWTAFGAGRVPVGVDASNALFDVVGDTGGSADAVVVSHTHTATSTFTGTALGNHSHTASQGAHDHTFSFNMQSDSGVGYPTGGAWSGNSDGNYTGTTSAAAPAISVSSNSAGTPAGTVSTTVASEGVSGVDKNYQPFIAVHMWKRTA